MKIKKIATLGVLLATSISLCSCDMSTNSNNDDNTELSPEVSTNTYTISFYLNDSIYTTKNVIEGATLTDIPATPTVEGYDVTWSITDFTNISSSIEVYAILTAKEYSITYYLDNELYETQTYSYGEKITPPTVNVQDGYLFSGFSNLPTTMTAGDISSYGTTINASDQIDLSSFNSSYSFDITAGGTYLFTGSAINVGISINTTEDVTIYLAGVNVTGLTKPFINATLCNSLGITVSGVSSLASESEDIDAIIVSNAEVTLGGSSELTINSKTVGILTSKCNLNIVSGTYNINSTDKSIQAKGKNASLNITGGNFTLISEDTALKVKVNITITDALINITASGDGINAEGEVLINSGTFIINSKNDGIQADTALTINGGTLTITTNGGYTSNSSLTTSSDYIFEIEDTADFTEASEYYGLYVLSGSTYIEIDESNYSSYSSSTVFYDKVDCKGLKSDGTVTINAGNITISSLDDGINSDTAVVINGGTLTINTACDGIQGDESVTVNGGLVTINTEALFYQTSAGSYQKTGTTYYKTSSDQMSGASSTKYDMYNSAKGIKSDSLVNISNGTITILSSDDAIHSDEYVEIVGGTTTVTTLDDGAHADTSLTVGTEGGLNDFVLTVTSSYEGLEAGNVYLNCGNIIVNSTDDGINAAGGNDSNSGDSFNPGGGMWRPGGRVVSSLATTSSYGLYINGGIITVSASGDGLDANGNIYVTGGKTIIYGPTDNSNAALDFDGTMTITGGEVLAIGSSGMLEYPTSHYVAFTGTNIQAGSAISIKDSSGNELISTTTTKSANSIIYCNAALSGTYTLLINNSATKTATAK